jgi:hypothetical protein
MPSRKLSQPGSNRSDRQPEPREHRQFLDVFEDEPATDIPSGTLAKAYNAIAKGNKGQPRNGSILWTTTYAPPVTGRTGYSAHTDGEYIVSDSGDIFSPGDVSYLWSWGNGIFDEIVEYISPTRVRRRDSDEQTGTDCYLQGRVNLWEWHNGQRRFVVQLGTDLYIVNYRMTSWTKVLVDCYWTPSNSNSTFREDGDYAIVANSRFVWRIIFTSNPPVAYPINMRVPMQNLPTNKSDGEKGRRYNYTMSLARLDGTDNFRNRQQDPPPFIFTETGTVPPDDDRVDWAEVWTNTQIGDGIDLYGVLEGGAGIDTDIANWVDIGDGSYQVNINNYGYVEISSDFGECATMYDLANVIQSDIRAYWPSATCEYTGEGGEPHLKITSGRVEGGNVAFVLDGVGGTPIAALLFLTQATGAQRSRQRVGVPKIHQHLWLSTVPWVSETLYQRWPTHYVIYRTPDYGIDGYHLDTEGERVTNSPDQFIWNKDLRVCGTFIARRVNGVIYVRDGEAGEFEKADEGSVVEFEDGSRVEIVKYGFIDSKTVRYTELTPDAYYGDVTTWMAACIGNARVCRVSQTGTTVTVYPGSSQVSFGALSADDVGKAGWWPNGSRSYIKRRISDTQWEVYDNTTRIESAFAVDPTHRAYCDTVSDDILFARASGWSCRNRFLREVKASNIVSMQSAFAMFMPRGGKEIRYCPTGPYYKQFLGYHNREYQTFETEDNIVAAHDFTGKMAVFCQSSIWSVPTDNSIEIEIPETLQILFQLPIITKRASFGISDYGSVHSIDDDVVRLVSNSHEVVDFDGWDIRQRDITVAETALGTLGRWKKALENSLPIFASISSRVTGSIIWWKKDARLE